MKIKKNQTLFITMISC